MRFIFGLLFALLLICVTIPPARALNASELSDDELITLLSSKEQQEAWDAMSEIVKRGPEMFPRLIKLRDDTSYFPTGIAYTNYVFPPTAPLRAQNDPRVPSMEVAALYLISAIYYKQLKFNPNAIQVYMVLVDVREDTTGHNGSNSQKNIDAAWKATLGWLGDCSILGINHMRQTRTAPLDSSQIRWIR